MPTRFTAIASDEGRFEPLSSQDIDSLSSSLNCGASGPWGADLADQQYQLRERVSDLIDDLDAVGFADHDKQVRGADVVDVLNKHLTELRKLVI